MGFLCIACKSAWSASNHTSHVCVTHITIQPLLTFHLSVCLLCSLVSKSHDGRLYSILHPRHLAWCLANRRANIIKFKDALKPLKWTKIMGGNIALFLNSKLVHGECPWGASHPTPHPPHSPHTLTIASLQDAIWICT